MMLHFLLYKWNVFGKLKTCLKGCFSKTIFLSLQVTYIKWEQSHRALGYITVNWKMCYIYKYDNKLKKDGQKAQNTERQNTSSLKK